MKHTSFLLAIMALSIAFAGVPRGTGRPQVQCALCV